MWATGAVPVVHISTAREQSPATIGRLPMGPEGKTIMAKEIRETKELRPRLTAARKFELYRATRTPEAPIGELLRQYGAHLEDLREIEETVESAALASLKVKGRHGRTLPAEEVTLERVEALEQELAEKTRALAELSVAYTLLEKKDREESRVRRVQASGSRRKISR